LWTGLASAALATAAIATEHKIIVARRLVSFMRLILFSSKQYRLVDRSRTKNLCLPADKPWLFRGHQIVNARYIRV
jgi:cytochrome b subunit of formate dehydrogenase